MSNIYFQEAIKNLLDKKEILKKEEILEEIKELRLDATQKNEIKEV